MKEVTYAEMDKAPKALGFPIRIIALDHKLRWYEHEAGGRLPGASFPDDGVVYPHHFGAIQGTLQVYGIADPIDFLGQLKTEG